MMLFFGSLNIYTPVYAQCCLAIKQKVTHFFSSPFSRWYHFSHVFDGTRCALLEIL